MNDYYKEFTIDIKPSGYSDMPFGTGNFNSRWEDFDTGPPVDSSYEGLIKEFRSRLYPDYISKEFYWVKYNNNWLIALYDCDNDWFICGSDEFFHSNDFSEIDPKPITRD